MFNTSNFSGKDKIEKVKEKIVADPPLIFPSDMKEGFYPEAIKFSVFERHGLDYEETKEIFKDAFSTAGGYIKADSERTLTKKKIDELVEEINSLDLSTQEGADILKSKTAEFEVSTSSNANARSKLANIESKFKGHVDKLTKTFKDVTDQKSFDRTVTDRLLQSIYLAMPESVNFAEGIDWQGTDLGVIGGLSSGALGWNEKSIDYGILAGGGAALGGAAGLAASLIPGISGIAGTVVGAVLGGSGLQSGIESTFGVKANPFKEQTFQGVGFRPFDFTFNFRARSQNDVILIQKIIRAFRQYSKPTFKAGTKGSIFKYPKEFRIEFLTLNQSNDYITNPYIPEIKFCVCTAINTNFTAQGWKSFEGGAPVDISLQLTFQETEIITGEDVAGDTDVGRFAGTGGNF